MITLHSHLNLKIFISKLQTIANPISEYYNNFDFISIEKTRTPFNNLTISIPIVTNTLEDVQLIFLLQ